MPRKIIFEHIPDKINRNLAAMAFVQIGGLPIIVDGKEAFIAPKKIDEGRWGPCNGWIIAIPAARGGVPCEMWVSRIPENRLDMRTMQKLCPNGKAEAFGYLPPGSHIDGTLFAERMYDPYATCGGLYPPLDEKGLTSPHLATERPFFFSRNSPKQTAPKVAINEPPLIEAPQN